MCCRTVTDNGQVQSFVEHSDYDSTSWESPACEPWQPTWDDPGEARRLDREHRIEEARERERNRRRSWYEPQGEQRRFRCAACSSRVKLENLMQHIGRAHRSDEHGPALLKAKWRLCKLTGFGPTRFHCPLCTGKQMIKVRHFYEHFRTEHDLNLRPKPRKKKVKPEPPRSWLSRVFRCLLCWD